MGASQKGMSPLTSESAPDRFRRRTRWPALVIIGALAFVATVTWIVVLKPEPPIDSSCNPPGAAPVTTSRASGTADATADATASAEESAEESAPAPSAVTTTLGEITDANTLRDTRPADPAVIPIRVVNAHSTPGLARTVTESLRRAGFESIRDASDDPLYPAADLRCWAEIRYGAAGSQAARTLLIVAPCATLVRDERFDDSVELALGALYEHEELTDEQRAELTTIKQAATPPAVLEGVTQAAPTTPPIPPLPSRANCPS